MGFGLGIHVTRLNRTGLQGLDFGIDGLTSQGEVFDSEYVGVAGEGEI